MQCRGNAGRPGQHVLLLITYKHSLRRPGRSFYAEAVVLPAVLSVQMEPNGQNSLRGYISHKSFTFQSFLDLDFTVQQLKKLLIEFNADCSDLYQRVQIGHCFMHSSNPKIVSSKILSVSSSKPLISICFTTSGESQCQLVQTENDLYETTFDKYVLVKVNAPQNACDGMKFVPCEGQRGVRMVSSFMAYVSDVIKRSSPPVQEICDILQEAQSHLLPETSIAEPLLTFRGFIVLVKPTNDSSLELEVKDYYGTQSVSVLVDGSKVTVPENLRPGTIASFHRTLLRRCSDGNIVLQTIPTSVITVHAVYKLKKTYSKLLDKINETQYMDMNLEPKKWCYISYLSNTSSITGIGLHCRVFAILELVFKWLTSPNGSTAHNPLHNIDFSAGCFLIDDGSGVAECCVYGASAVSGFLQLSSHSVPGGMYKDTVQEFCTVVQNHGHVVYRKEYSDDWTTQQQCQVVRNDKSLSETEQAIVESFVARTSHAAPLVLVCDLLRRGSENSKRVRLVANSVKTLCYTTEAERLSRELELTLKIKHR